MIPMRATRLLPTLLLLTLVSALLWLSYRYASTYELFGSNALATFFRAAAAVASAALFIIVMTQVVFRPGFAWLRQREPTQLQHGLAVALTAFVAAATVLTTFGVDLSTILTTSALVTAIVGLSVQPLLASMMSGLALQRTLRIGDGILQNGETLAITSLNWRSVVARRVNGAQVVLPNAMLVAERLEVLPYDRAVRAEITLDVPAAIPPHRVRDAMIGVIDDFAEVDALKPMTVTLRAALENGSSLGYWATFWVRSYRDRSAVEERVLRRCWYALRRERIIESGGDSGAPNDITSATVARLLSASAANESRPDEALAEVLAGGETLYFDDGERVTLPERCDGFVCMLRSGQLGEAGVDADNDDNADSDGAENSAVGNQGGRGSGNGTGSSVDHDIDNDGNVWGAANAAARRAFDAADSSAPAPTRAIALARIERALAAHIGPYATHAVRRAAANGATLVAVCTTVAAEIYDEAHRRDFLRAVNPPPRHLRNPGFVFRCRRDAAGKLTADPPLRAIQHAEVIAAPEMTF